MQNIGVGLLNLYDTNGKMMDESEQAAFSREMNSRLAMDENKTVRVKRAAALLLKTVLQADDKMLPEDVRLAREALLKVDAI